VPQGFEVVRLKDKLGTRQLPTAELRLTGMRALKVRRRPGWLGEVSLCL
jgi:alkylation response protein AidB-like acyl-CoA dehydrogenase